MEPIEPTPVPTPRYTVGGSLKAVASFVVSFGVFLGAVVADPDIASALPEGWLKWLTVVAVPAVVGAGTWLTRQRPTVEEAEAILARAKARAIGQ